MKQREIERPKVEPAARPLQYAGTQLILELWEARHLDDIALIRRILIDAVRACDATLLNIDLHQFSSTGGVSGVAVIAESHITIHTWPEFSYAAIDIFMCGRADPMKAIDVLKDGFEPKQIQAVEIKRGVSVERSMVF